jgi:hypothetical protein
MPSALALREVETLFASPHADGVAWMTECRLCRGRGSRVIAAICDPHWTTDDTSRPTLAASFAIPIVVPCLCVAKRAAENRVPA